MSDLLKRLSEGVLLADGAMGTMLHSHGVSFDKCFDELNLSKPEAVADIHREYIEAGAQLILSNTFGANRFKLAKHGLGRPGCAKSIGPVWSWRGAQRDRRPDRILIAADVGPLGVRIAPFGRVQPEQAREAFAEQIGALCGSGADLIVIETISDLYEMQEAVKAQGRSAGCRWSPP